MNTKIILIAILLVCPSVLCTGGVHEVNVNSIPIPSATVGDLIGGPKDNYLDRFDAENKVEDALAFKAVRSHIEDNINIDGYTFNKVERLTVQLVAGKRYNFVVSYINNESHVRYFEVSVWVKAWEQFAQVTSALEVDAIRDEEFPRYGGEVERELDIVNNANDARVFNTVVEEIEKRHTLSKLGFEFIGTSHLTTQLVAGTIYSFDITFGNQNIGVSRTFSVKAVVIPWQNVCEVFSIEEKSESLKEEMKGSAEAYTFDLASNPVDKLVFGAVNARVMATLGAENSRWTFVEIRNATRQLVSGTIYDFDIVYSDLNNNERVFEASVYVVPWENKLEISSLKLKV